MQSIIFCVISSILMLFLDPITSTLSIKKSTLKQEIYEKIVEDMLMGTSSLRKDFLFAEGEGIVQ